MAHSAIQFGLLARSLEAGHLFINTGEGAPIKMSAKSAIAEGFIDQAAADLVGRQPGVLEAMRPSATIQLPAATPEKSPEVIFMEALEDYLRARGSIRVATVVKAFRTAVRAVE